MLSDAKMTEWERIFLVDVDLLNVIALWLTSQQDVQTGAFSEKTIWFDRKMLDPVHEDNQFVMSYHTIAHK